MTKSPTHENPSSGTGNAPVSAEKRFDLAEGFLKAVLNLATGALVFSVTFLHEIVGVGGDKAPAVIQDRFSIAGSWMAFLVSVGAALYYLYFLAVAAKFERGYSAHLRWSSLIAIYTFAAGLLLLGLFAWFNLPVSI
ncbi:MAG: hypothetical protein ABSC10_20530 [Candidatus Acidiferrales bacterium]